MSSYDEDTQRNILLSLLTNVQKIDKATSTNEVTFLKRIKAKATTSETFIAECNNVGPKKSGASNFKCVYCKKKSKNELDLHAHIQNHWKKDKNNSCPVCEKFFNSVPVFLKHHRSMHQIKCPYCDEAAEEKQEIIKHMKIHVKRSEFECPKCDDQMFTSGEMLLDHMKRHEKGVRCEMCGKVFSHRCNLKPHIRIHLNIRPYSCPSCPKAFPAKRTLQLHIYNQHTDNIPLYPCTECGRKFKKKCLLEQHLLRHTGQTPYTCDICDQQFPDPRSLYSHGKSHVKPTKCSYCSKLIKYASCLREHERTHVNPEMHPCSVCEKKFETPRKLRDHLRRHAPRPECPSCKKTFASASYMQQHFMSMHDGGGDHVCNICDKKFAIKAHLDAHALLHREEKPFKCPLCPYACRSKSNMPKHIRIHKKREEMNRQDES